jgi:NAD+ synthase
MEALAGRLTAWIREQVTGAGCSGAVVGMSGGVDSAVAAALCKRAFPENMIGVLMPCHSAPEDAAHAQMVAARFGIPTRVVVLDGIYDALLRALPAAEVPPERQRTAVSNLKPRLRMMVLYYLAKQRGYLVVGSGNRSELATGYFTKYGDGGVDILPLGNLVKAQVRELAGFLGVPQEIIDRPPSAGLWPGQTDEAELGISYQELDHYLITGEAAAGAHRRIQSLMAASRHKLRPPPVPDFPP